MSRPKSDPKLPTGPGERILRAIGRYHLITGPQALRILGYSPTSKTFVYEQLKRLTDQGYTIKGESIIKGVPAIWQLTERGRQYLIANGYGVDEKVHHLPPKSLHLAHRVCVVDVLIAFDELALTDPRFVVLEMVNEVTLSRRPTRLTLSDGKKWGYSPDAWIHYAVDGEESAIAIELDRGTEEQRVWRRKVELIVEYTKKSSGKPSPYEEKFGFPKLKMAVVSVPGPEVPNTLRAKNLHRWTELELKKLEKSNWSSVFRVAPADPATEPPTDLLLSSRWVMPGTTEGEPLIGGLV